jgi:hypothetical protein
LSVATVDWTMAERVASQLGALTRALVASHDVEAIGDWALQMADECGRASLANHPRAASYLELAVFVGRTARDNDDNERAE